jgi:hypothetical protein
VIEDHDATLQLIDVEPLLDDSRIVLHYLGPHRLDAGELLATLWSTCKIDGVLERAGRDVPDRLNRSEDGHGCGHCGSGCGVPESGGRRTPGSDFSRGACSDCGTKCVLASARAL